MELGSSKNRENVFILVSLLLHFLLHATLNIIFVVDTETF